MYIYIFRAGTLMGEKLQHLYSHKNGDAEGQMNTLLDYSHDICFSIHLLPSYGFSGDLDIETFQGISMMQHLVSSHAMCLVVEKYCGDLEHFIPGVLPGLLGRWSGRLSRPDTFGIPD